MVTVRCEIVERGSQSNRLGQGAGSVGAGVSSGFGVGAGTASFSSSMGSVPSEPAATDLVEPVVPVTIEAGERDPSELVSSLLEALVGDPWTNGLLRSVWQGQPIIVSEIVASPALLERVLAVAERALESSGRAACSVSAWMAEHNGKVEDWMASMSTGRQPGM